MIPKYIMDFIKEIAPENENLYLSCFDEKTCLKDATNLIQKLKAQNKRMLEALKDAYMSGYESGHNDTVESCYGWIEEKADEWISENIKDVGYEK